MLKKLIFKGKEKTTEEEILKGTLDEIMELKYRSTECLAGEILKLADYERSVCVKVEGVHNLEQGVQEKINETIDSLNSKGYMIILETYGIKEKMIEPLKKLYKGHFGY